MSSADWPADVTAPARVLPPAARSPDVRELTRAVARGSPGGTWYRLSLALAAGAAVSAGLLPLLPAHLGVVAENLVVVLAPLVAAAACLGARAGAASGGRATWLLVALGAVLAAAGQAHAARIELMDGYLPFPSAGFYLMVAFHVAFAEGAILALRPAREPRLAVEIALDGLLLLLAATALVLRFVLEEPLARGWLTTPQVAAMLLGQFAVAASLFFVALLVFWRDTELSGPVVDGLLVTALFFGFGNFIVTLGLEPAQGADGTALELIRLGGWLALSLTAALATLRPESSPPGDRREVASRRFRQLIIPGSALFLTAWAMDAAQRATASRPALVVVGVMGVLLAVRIGAATYAVEQESRERRRAEQQAARARIRSLTARMNPHFLFNALHSLSALVRRDPSASERALERLGGLLRYGIDSGDHAVLLEEERRFARNYLDLEELRLGPRLTVKEEFAPETLELAVPPFILQPLVENAVRHGVSPFPQGGTIRIRTLLHGDRLVIEVHDTGPGATVEAMNRAPGVGVRGVRAQLQTHFGEDWSMEAGPAPEGGFLVRLRLPADSD